MSPSVFPAIGVSLALLAAPALGQGAASAPENEFLKRFDEEAAEARAAWLKKKSRAEATAHFLKSIGDVPPGHSEFAHFEALKAQHKKEIEEAQKAETTALDLSQKAFRARSLTAGVARTPVPAASPPANPPEIAAANCILDTDLDVKNFDPGACLTGGGGVSQGTLSLLGRVVDKQGVTASLSVSGSGSKASVRLADTYTIRSRGDTADFYQRKWTLGYNIGVQTTNVTGSEGRLGGLSERSKTRSLTDLDRLDEKISVSGGVSFNKFPRVLAPQFLAGAQPLVDSARRACELENQPNQPQVQCSGRNLVDWINNNPQHLAAFTSHYWGTTQQVAEWGVGLQAELARPVFSYFPFELIEVPDPFNPGSTKQVVDLSRIPTSFPDDPNKEAKLPFAITTYAFRHFSSGVQWNEGITLIGSGTWKRSYEIDKPRRDVIICPVSDGVPTETNELCQTVNVAAPGGISDYLLAGELRTKFGKFWIFPSIGLAPKFTQELKRGRRSLDIPVYVSADKDGKLNGGLRLKWDTGGRNVFGVDRKDELLLSIFFGTTFDFNVTP